MKIFIIILLSTFSLTCIAQNETEYLTKSEVESDLAFLDGILQKKSSYQGLNGYNYKKAFGAYLQKIKGNSITKYDFEVFLTTTIGKIGDRHAYIKGDKIRDTLFLPIAFAPYGNKVVVINYNRKRKEYGFHDTEFPYLKSINNIPIEKILPKILPEEIRAPKASYATRAIRKLRDIELVFKSLGVPLPNPIKIKLINNNGVEKEVSIDLVSKKYRARYWDERFYRNIYAIQDKQYNDRTFIKKFFKLEKNIGYIQIADMVHKEDSPVFFEHLNQFMIKAQGSNALIIDVRDNAGGNRDLIQELAGYIVHPDSIYVVNVARQRGKLPLTSELKKGLHNRYLFSKEELNTKERNAAAEFMTSFKPMYDLDNEKFSEFHFYVLNGKKISQNKYHYNQPIYILANERSFSAASILVSVFKGLPNVKIIGVNTDGSSGNSQRFELPHSALRGKISTMVSFQKNGEILDGIGTEPDLVIERDLNQIFWEEDSQLTKIMELITKK